MHAAMYFEPNVISTFIYSANIYVNKASWYVVPVLDILTTLLALTYAEGKNISER